MRSLLKAAILGLGIALIAPASALATTVKISSSGKEIQVTAGNNETNQVGVSFDMAMDLYTVRDAVAITPTAPCTPAGANRATCPGAGITSLKVSLGNRNDSVELDVPTIPTALTTRLEGSSGNDAMRGANGVDVFRAGSGSDVMTGFKGADDLEGGSQTDTVSYLERSAAVTVTVQPAGANDGNSDDQTGNSRDDVDNDVEVVLGGSGPDALIGDNSRETLIGNDGDDFIFGMGGGDTLLGGNGNDQLLGGSGDDTERGSLGDDSLRGGPDDDRLAAGPDDDFLKGKKGVDIMKGKTGIDQIRAKDGTRDRKIKCGPGDNSLESARRDKHLDPRARSC